MQKGVLLINLGTPANCSVKSVRSYLRSFLVDKRVINLPVLLRYIVVYIAILPFRPKQSAKAYQAIWTNEGSPLMVYSQRLTKALQASLKLPVALAMRYNEPSIANALSALTHCESISVLPLYPQYSSAATGSALEALFELLKHQSHIPHLNIIREFYYCPEFITAQARLIQSYLKPNNHLLFSYHGLPEREINKSGCDIICENCCDFSKNLFCCYRAQCYKTTQLLAQYLKLPPNDYSVAFQSRLGKTPWIKPYLEDVFEQLIHQGVTHLTVACPSFTVDCLETLEEMGIRNRKLWHSLGGLSFTLVPALNDSPEWIEALIHLIDR